MNTLNAQKPQDGFTLVEITIVLVIISLVFISFFQVKELIENAKVKSVISDLNGVAVSYYAYKDRTGLTPGDADHNGKIDATNTFWQDLRTEGYLVGAANDNSPITHALQGNVVALSSPAFNAANTICADNIRSQYAKAIDEQIDDGIAQSGDVRSSDLTAYPADDEELITICKKLSSVNP